MIHKIKHLICSYKSIQKTERKNKSKKMKGDKNYIEKIILKRNSIR